MNADPLHTFKWAFVSGPKFQKFSPFPAQQSLGLFLGSRYRSLYLQVRVDIPPEEPLAPYGPRGPGVLIRLSTCHTQAHVFM